MENKKHLVEADVLLFALGSALFLWLCKSSVLTSLFFWDELLVYVQPVRIMYERGLAQMIMNGDIFNGDNFFNHPLGMTLFLYPFVKIFGFTPFVLRLVTLVLFWLSMIFTYKLGKSLGGRTLGLCAGAALFVFPNTFTMSTMILGDIYFLFFSVGFVYFLLKKETSYSLWFFALSMGFIRETALAFCPMIFAWYWVRRELNLKNVLLSFAPCLGTFFFFLGNFFYSGVILKHHAFENGDISFLSFSGTFKTAFENSFFYGEKSIITFSGLFFFFVLFLFERRFSWKKELVFLFIPILSFLFFFSFDKGLLDRYFIPVLPFLCLLSFYPIVKFSKMTALLFLVLLLIRLPFPAFGSYTFKIGTAFEHSMEYLEVQKVQEDALRYIAKEYPAKRFWTRWPLDVMLSDSFFSYVPYSLKVVNEEQAKRGEFDLYVWASNMQNEFSNLEERDFWIKKQKLRLIKSFYYRNKFVDIYSK